MLYTYLGLGVVRWTWSEQFPSNSELLPDLAVGDLWGERGLRTNEVCAGTTTLNYASVPAWVCLSVASSVGDILWLISWRC